MYIKGFDFRERVISYKLFDVFIVSPVLKSRPLVYGPLRIFVSLAPRYKVNDTWSRSMA